MKRLSGWDMLMLTSETPNVHQHTLKVAVVDTTEFEGTPTFEAFREVFRSRLRMLEPLRYQLVDPPWRLHRPIWRQGAEIDLDCHLQHVQVSAPGGRRELDAVIGAVASTPLDRNRPLWQFHYAEGMTGGLIAVIGKMHHVLADGVASANLMARAVEWPDDEPTPDYVEETLSPPTTGQVVRFSAQDHLERLRHLPKAVRSGVIGAYRLQHRIRRRHRHPELASQFNPPATFINHKLTSGRTFASAALPLVDVKAVSKKLDATINDVVLTTTAGALRRLLLHHGEPADRPLIASVPASTDTSPDRVAGNALATMLVSLPVQVDDAMRRLRLIRTSTRIAKEDHQLLGPTLVGQLLEFVPPAVTRMTFRWMARREAPNQLFNLIVSNVAGPRERGRIAGAVITEFYSVGPIAAGAALNVTVWSYVDQLSVSVLADDNTFHDTHEVTDAFVEAFAELSAVAGLGSADTTSAAIRRH